MRSDVFRIVRNIFKMTEALIYTINDLVGYTIAFIVGYYIIITIHL